MGTQLPQCWVGRSQTPPCPTAEDWGCQDLPLAEEHPRLCHPGDTPVPGDTKFPSVAPTCTREASSLGHQCLGAVGKQGLCEGAGLLVAGGAGWPVSQADGWPAEWQTGGHLLVSQPVVLLVGWDAGGLWLVSWLRCWLPGCLADCFFGQDTG